MTLNLSQLTHAGMDLQLLNQANVGTKWNIMKKGRTSMTRRPRKPGTDSFELVYSIQEPAAFESKKPGTLKAVDASSKKRRLLHQSSSPVSKTVCINGEGVSTGPQTPSVHHEGSGQRSSPLSKSQKTKSKTGLRNSKMKKTKKGLLNPHDFSGILLLADVACSSFIHENADHVEGFSLSKEHTTPEAKTCSIGIKEAIVSPGSNCSAAQQNAYDTGKEVEKKVAPSKGLRLHLDLNTVPDEWEDPCDDLLIEPVKNRDASISVVPLIESCNVDSCKETYKLVEDLEVTGTKMAKASDGESSGSKSEVVDSLTHPVKCEDPYASTTSVLKEQIIANCESGTIDGPKLDHQPVSGKIIQGFCDNKVDDHVSECCGSNVTQEEQGHMAAGDLEEKNQVGYDSPFEDGELREPVEKPEKEAVYTDDFGTIENPLLGKVDHGQTVDNPHSLLVKEFVPNNETKQGVKVDTYERSRFDESGKDVCERKGGHGDESTSFDMCRNGEYIHRIRSSNIGDPSSRGWDLKSHRSLDRNYSRNYNSRGGGYRTQDRRPSPSERNNGYGGYRGPAPARSHGGERYRYHAQDYSDPKPCYSEVKPHISSSFNRSGARSRSRSGSPIAWNFQKRKNLDTSDSIGEIKTGTRGGHVSPERFSKCIDDQYRFRDDQFRDKRRAPVTMIQQKRYDPAGYSERLKPDDYYRFNQRSARFSQTTGYKYKDNGDDIRKHDGYHDKVNRVGRSVDDGVRRFRYAYN